MHGSAVVDGTRSIIRSTIEDSTRRKGTVDVVIVVERQANLL